MAGVGGFSLRTRATSGMSGTPQHDRMMSGQPGHSEMRPMTTASQAARSGFYSPDVATSSRYAVSGW
jgi:hypothetical protein